MKRLIDRRTLLLASAAGVATIHAAETPIACNLKALTGDERRAHRERSERLFAAPKATPIESGYAISWPAALFLEVAHWVELERKCCPFLRFQLESAAETGDVLLRLTGRAGVKEFLKEELRLGK